jgi:ligand-binding sensor domain-containing protein
MRKCIFLAFAVLFCSLVFAQGEELAFSRIDIYNGLSHNQVNTVLKTPDGFVWFGTMSGLDRYDGYSFKIFRTNSHDSFTINDNYVSNLFELPGGKMWVVTRIAPCIFDPKMYIRS